MAKKNDINKIAGINDRKELTVGQKLKKFWRHSFKRDILVLMIISVLLGSALAGAVAMTTNRYFSQTVSNLVGDYGEHDLVIQVREEMREDSLSQINKIIVETLPGASLKEGVAITGKAPFFITLPPEYKTKEIYSNLGKIFGSIPGGAGVGVISEPRLNVRGVPEGARSMVIEEIEEMNGVSFAFRDGGSIGVILASLEQTGPVSAKIKTLLEDYQIIEISFPVGSEPLNPVKLGETVADALEAKLKLPYARSVSSDEKKGEMAYLASTLAELKKFLTAYRTQVTIQPKEGTKFLPGDKIIFPGKAENGLVLGDAPSKGNVIAEVETVLNDGTAQGRITQGDSSYLKDTDGNIQEGYLLAKDIVTETTVSITLKNPREELGGALSKAGELAWQIPGFVQNTRDMGGIALQALDNYDDSVRAAEKILDGLGAAGNTITAATGSLANLNTTALQYQFQNSSKTLGTLITSLEVLKLVNADVNSTITSLTVTKRNLDAVKDGLKTLDNAAVNAKRAKTAIDTIVASGQVSLNVLRSFDVPGVRRNLSEATARLSTVEEMNIPVVAAQLEYLSKAVPSLKDEDISHTIDILDKAIAGEVIPGARLQILTTSGISAEAVKPVAAQEAGSDNLSVYSSSLGVIEPNTRSEVQQILREVKSVLAAMTAIVVTLLFLGLDHTAVMTFMRRKRLNRNIEFLAGKKKIRRKFGGFSNGEKWYGMGMGAVMLTGMFIMSGGGLPYLPWIGVPALGAVLGFVVACYAEKISPVSAEEVTAGEALGLSADEIMREIIIPSARPGLLQKLNSRKVKFK